MGKIKYICFSLFLLLIFINITYADTCDSNDIKRLREIANNVTVSYVINQEAVNNNDYDTFDLEVTGITNELYFYFDEDEEDYYIYEDTDNGNIIFKYPSGDYEINILSYNCGDELRTVSIKIPTFNIVSQDDRCKEDKYKDLDICDEWYQWPVSIESEDFDLNSYFNDNSLDKEDIINFVNKYYYLFVVIVVVVILFVILFIIRQRKRWSLE